MRSVGVRVPKLSTMANGRNANGFDDFFTPRMAKRAADRYRKKGIDKTAGRMPAFRAFVHPPPRMMAVVGARGLVQELSYRPILWQIAGFARRD